jgi:outer membrane protein OmpA-like peptidoglycan-associated protein
MTEPTTTARKRESEKTMNANLIPLLIVALLLNVSPLLAREIRQERFSLLSETVRLTDRETFVLTDTPNLRQPACGEKVTEATDGCELPVVHFQLGSAELSETEQADLLAALAHCSIAPGTGVAVTGHACSLGTKDRNSVLSEKRAEQVAALLRAHGYFVSEAVGMGSRHPIPGNRQLANNRRVELALTQP